MAAQSRPARERARRVLERADVLAGSTDEPGRVTRFYGTPSLIEASQHVWTWMEEAGLTVRRDAVGNVIGRLEPPGSRGTVVVGSHLDSVRDAGRYDGPLGVLVGIEAADELGAAEARLPFAVEVVAFADEEGARFGTSYLGSRGYVGLLEERDLGRTDEDGAPILWAIELMGGGPGEIRSARSAPGDLLAYLEVHIEQGPVLQERDLPVGVVTQIAGQSGGRAVFVGTSGHAGTTPMSLRRDALAAAAAFVLEVERIGRDRDGLVATVGRIANEPNVGNVIPGRATVSFDCRAADDLVRERAVAALRQAARAISAERGVELEWSAVHDDPAVPTSSRLREVLAEACAHAGVEPTELASGAGHDAVSLARLTPDVAMLFVRCKDGISHNPAESVREDDVAVAIDVLVHALPLVGRGGSS